MGPKWAVIASFKGKARIFMCLYGLFHTRLRTSAAVLLEVFGAVTKASFKPLCVHILPAISPSHTNSADDKSKQGRQPEDSNLHPAGLAAGEQIMQHLMAEMGGGSLWSRRELVFILYCNVGSVSPHPRLATSSSWRMMNATEMSNIMTWSPSLGTSCGKRMRVPQASPDSHHHHLCKSLSRCHWGNHQVAPGQVSGNGSPFEFLMSPW